VNLGDRLFRGAIWSFAEKLSVQLVSFLLGVILARLLSPKEYGVFGLLLVFITISQVFIDSGFSQALIQKQERTKKDISTVFSFNLIISLLCFSILFCIAPLIANFYQEPELTGLLRIMSFSLLLNALFSLPITLLTIDLNFKEIAKITLISTVLSGGIAIYLAYTNWGAWALVVQNLVKGSLMALLGWFFIKERILPKIHKHSFKALFSFGSKLLVSNLLSSILSNINAILIGKYIGTKELGFFTRGTQFSDVLYSVLNASLNNVLLPGLSSIQDDHKKMISYSSTILKTTSLVTVPVFFGLFLLAEPIILALLTEKWLMAVPIVQIMSIARLITIFIGIGSNMLYAVGRTDLTLKQEYVKIIVRLALLVVALPFGIVYLAIAELSATFIHFFINNYYPKKLFNYGTKAQLKDISKILVAGLIMVGVGYMAIQFLENPWLKISFGMPLSAVTYIGVLKLLKVAELDQLVLKLQTLKKSK
jgi:teichuronic acid exporter